MKKILFLLLIPIFLSSCGGEGPPPEGFGYRISNDTSTEDTSYILVLTDYELPEFRVQDFLGTIVLFLTEPELDNDRDIHIGLYDKDGKEFQVDFYPSSVQCDFNNSHQVSVDNNSNFDSNVIIPTDINYYTTIITANSRWAGIERAIQLYFRQDLDTTVISFMIRIKPDNATDYEYFGHTVLNKITRDLVGIATKPLPDILR